MDKRALSALVTMAAISMAATMHQLPRGRAARNFDSESRARRNQFDRQAAYQKHLASEKLTEEQRIWNDAVEAKKTAKKTAKKATP